MKLLKPKRPDTVSEEYAILKSSRLILELYSKYTNYPEGEVLDHFLLEILKEDTDFVEWILRLRTLFTLSRITKKRRREFLRNIIPSRIFEITKECEYPCDYVVLDFETTGLNPKDCHIIQMAAIRYRNDLKVSRFVSFVNTTVVPPKVTELTSITIEDCQSAPILEELLPQLLDFIGEDVIVAHNASFDLSFLIEAMQRLNLSGRTFIYIDTLRLARQKMKEVRRYMTHLYSRNSLAMHGLRLEYFSRNEYLFPYKLFRRPQFLIFYHHPSF